MRQDVRRLPSLFLAAIMVAAQWAGQLHALSHAEHDLDVALVAATNAACSDDHHDDVPPLDHSAEHCLAFHALDNAVTIAATVNLWFSPASLDLVPLQLFLLPLEALPYCSRASPISIS